MVQQRPRWRFHISTLMILVIILALVIERRRMEQELQRARAEVAVVQAESELARAEFAAAQAAYARSIAVLQKALDASREALAKAQRTLVAIDELTKTAGPPKFECHLDVAERSGSAPSDFGGEFTLKNTSAEPVRIEYHTDPTVGLDLDVKDEKGKNLPKCLKAYGYIYSPVHAGPDVLTIKPGETYRTHVRLFNQVDTEKHPVTPGKYTVEATFKWWTPSGTAASVLWWTPSGTAASVKSNKATIEFTAK
jgi:hypothetical protein